MVIANTTAQSNVISLLTLYVESAVTQVIWLVTALTGNAGPIGAMVLKVREQVDLPQAVSEEAMLLIAKWM